MDAGRPFMAGGEAPEAVQPGEAPLNDPSALADPLAAFDTTTGSVRKDAARTALAAAATMIIGLASMPLAGPAAGRP